MEIVWKDNIPEVTDAASSSSTADSSCSQEAGVHQGGPLGAQIDRFGRCGLRSVASVMTRATYHCLHRQEP